MPYPSPMPEYQPLFHQVQNFIADQLNSDPQLSGIGIEFLPESQLDIEYGIKRNLGRQGMVGIVNTLKGTYGGHDQDSCAWEIESEIDVLETPTVRRAWLKQNSLSAGTTVDVLNYIQESLCGPASPTYGKFCPVTQEIGEDNGVVVGKAVIKTFAISDVSACVSGESNWHIRYATEADISALWSAVDELSAELSGSEEVWNAISALNINKRDYLDLTLNADGRIADIDPLLPQGGIESFYLEWTNPRGRIDTIDMVQYTNEDGTMSWKSQYEPYEVTYDAETQKFNLLERGTSILEFTGLSSEGIPVQINWEWLDEPYVFDALLKNHAISTSLATMMDLDSLSQKVETLDDLAVKYTDDDKVQVVLNRPDTPMTLTFNDLSASPGNATIRFPGTNHISQKSLTLGVPPDGFEASAYGSTSVQFGGTHNDADLVLGAGIHIISSTEKGKSQILMDDQRLYVVTPAEVSAGQTLKAVKVFDDPTLNTMSFRGMKSSNEMKSREEPSLRDEPKWHWEYHSANLPDKTSDLTNDSGYVTSSEVSAEISSVSQEVSSISQDIQDLSAQTIERFNQIGNDISALSAEIDEVSANMSKSIIRRWEYVEYNGLTFTAEEANSTIAMQKFGAAPDVSLEYSTGDGWHDFIVGTTTVTLANVGDECFIRAKTTNSGMGQLGGFNKFVMTGRVASEDSIDYLLDKDGEVSGVYPEYCYYNMFNNCSSLITPPELPHQELSSYCYYNMFANCTNLSAAPELPATSLGVGCYYNMFVNCTNLSAAPELPATILPENCYLNMFLWCRNLQIPPSFIHAQTTGEQCCQSMFSGCRSLTSTPDIQLSSLSRCCCSDMFANCSSLTAAPELSSVELEDQCYSGMFSGCTSLTTAPDLPATTLAYGCYAQMFSGCNSLVKAPVISSEQLASQCFFMMFNNCSSLNEIKLAYTGNFDQTHFNNWVQGVSASGTFYYDGTYTTRGASAIPVGWTVEPITPPYRGLRFTSQENDSTWSLDNSNLEYSTDGGSTWTNYTATTTMTLDNGEEMYIRARTPQTMISKTFSMSGKIAASGILESLLDPDYESVSALAESAFIDLFNGCQALTSAPIMNATIARQGAFTSMFAGCSNLSGEVVFPNLKQDENNSMATAFWYSGISRFYAPRLESIWNLYCSFQNCTNLSSVEFPVLKDANTQQDYGLYCTFQGCTSLKRVDFGEVSAFNPTSMTTEAFSGCTSLEEIDCSKVSVPLPCNDFNNMFENTNPTFKVVVPDSLYSTWLQTGDWATGASHIVKASEYNDN